MTDILYGRQPIYEALRARRRTLRRVLLAEGVRDSAILAQIADLAAEQALPIEYLPRQHLTDLAGTEHHQGAVLEAAPAPRLAGDFREYVLSTAGQRILQRWGFMGVQP